MYRCAKVGGIAEAAAWERGGVGRGLKVGERGELSLEERPGQAVKSQART